MSKPEKMLSFMKAHVGEWCCAVCSSNSGQPAATFREIKNLGYKFEETSQGRWAKDMYCPKCGVERTHYKLLSLEPEFDAKPRIPIPLRVRKKIKKLLDNRDAITGASITSVAEADHKTPWTRLDADIDTTKLSDEELLKNFQLLTGEHNLLKDRMCSKCKETGMRQPFLEIAYWYAGDERYLGTCEGCGWYDAKKWREVVNEILNSGE